MRLSFQITLVIVIGLGTIYGGVHNLVSPSDVLMAFYQLDTKGLSADIQFAIETQMRLLSGMWVAAGLMVILSAPRFEANTNLLRLVLLGLSLGALGEFLSVYQHNGDIGAALVKSLLQVGLCVGMEIWRAYLVKRPEKEAA